jgi:hypothetical protein
MKEYPEPNYILDVRWLVNEQEPAVARFLTGGWILTINYIASVTFLPYLPTSPWPPLPAVDLDVAHDPDEAARVVLSTSTQLVTPTDGAERIEELSGEIPEKQTVFWVTPGHYAELDVDLRSLTGRPYVPDHQLQLSDLGNGALRAFLKNDLPRSAALSDYDRKILCLQSHGNT